MTGRVIHYLASTFVSFRRFSRLFKRATFLFVWYDSAIRCQCCENHKDTGIGNRHSKYSGQFGDGARSCINFSQWYSWLMDTAHSFRYRYSFHDASNGYASFPIKGPCSSKDWFSRCNDFPRGPCYSAYASSVQLPEPQSLHIFWNMQL